VCAVRYEFGLELTLVENNVLSYNRVCQSLIAAGGHQIISEFKVIRIPYSIERIHRFDPTNCTTGSNMRHLRCLSYMLRPLHGHGQGGFLQRNRTANSVSVSF
jgi:hypothetical protein